LFALLRAFLLPAAGKAGDSLLLPALLCAQPRRQASGTCFSPALTPALNPAGKPEMAGPLPALLFVFPSWPACRRTDLGYVCGASAVGAGRAIRAGLSLPFRGPRAVVSHKKAGPKTAFVFWPAFYRVILQKTPVRQAVWAAPALSCGNPSSSRQRDCRGSAAAARSRPL